MIHGSLCLCNCALNMTNPRNNDKKMLDGALEERLFFELRRMQMSDKQDPVLMVAKRKVKRRKHHSHSRHRSEGYSKSVHAGRYRSFDNVETSFLGVLVKVLIMVGAIALVLWALASLM